MAPRLGELSDRPGDRIKCIPEQMRSQDQRDGGWSKEIHVEATFSEPMMTKSSFTTGLSSQPSFIELPSQAPHTPHCAPWIDVSAQISSLGTRMEELALVHYSRFYSMEEHMDQYQTGVTSQFDHFQQRFERIEERMDQQ
ncbi:hypothetical protein CK203_056553 [Vitis vinifera]|uniref:Uncharacterized protein n=1 Tax=Vitis vinifera TaxID=29760 RepID=A0A438GKD0_VITVI|nr:hypothetical protein CK203_056553 [Vitis vinifera]